MLKQQKFPYLQPMPEKEKTKISTFAGYEMTGISQTKAGI